MLPLSAATSASIAGRAVTVETDNLWDTGAFVDR